MGRVRKYTIAKNPELIPQYTDYNGVVISVSKGNVAGICGKCGETFRTLTTAGACCPKCGAGNFKEVYGGYARIDTREPTFIKNTTQNILRYENVFLNTENDKEVVVFKVVVQGEIVWDGNSITSSKSYSISESDILRLTENDEAVIAAINWRKSLPYYNHNFSFDFLNAAIAAYRKNTNFKKLVVMYPEEMNTIHRNGHSLEKINSIDDICDVMGVPVELRAYRKYAIEFSNAEDLRVIIASPNGKTLARYIERDAFNQNTIDEIAKSIKFVDSVMGKREIDSRIDWQFRVMRGDIGPHKPYYNESGVETGPIEKEILELFYDFQAKNCLIYGSCWKEFIKRCRWLMQNAILVTEETLDTKNWHTAKNKATIGKPKFYDLVIDDPLKAIDFI